MCNKQWKAISSVKKQENITVKEKISQHKWPPKWQMMELINKSTNQLLKLYLKIEREP